MEICASWPRRTSSRIAFHNYKHIYSRYARENHKYIALHYDTVPPLCDMSPQRDATPKAINHSTIVLIREFMQHLKFNVIGSTYQEAKASRLRKPAMLYLSAGDHIRNSLISGRRCKRKI